MTQRWSDLSKANVELRMNVGNDKRYILTDGRKKQKKEGEVFLNGSKDVPYFQTTPLSSTVGDFNKLIINKVIYQELCQTILQARHRVFEQQEDEVVSWDHHHRHPQHVLITGYA